MAIDLTPYKSWDSNAHNSALKQIGYTGNNADADYQSYLKSLYGQGESQYGNLYDYQAARRAMQPTYQLKQDGIDLGSWAPANGAANVTANLPGIGIGSGTSNGIYSNGMVTPAQTTGDQPLWTKEQQAATLAPGVTLPTAPTTGGGLLGAAGASVNPTGTNSGTVTQAASYPAITATTWGPDANLQLLQSIGYGGNAVGHGEAGQYLQQLAQAGNYNALSQYEQGRQRLDPTYSLAQEGITLPPGVLPNTVQDFNSVQNTALDNLAAGAPTTSFAQSLDPLYKQLVDKIGALGNSGPYDPNSASAFMNPYQQQVIDAYDAQATAGFDKIANQIAARNARNGNAGGSPESNMLGGAATDILNNRNSNIANLLSSGYTQAQQLAQDAFYKDLQNKYTGANALGSVLSTGQGLDNYLTEQYYNKNNIALGAGNTVQAQNQKQLDAANGTQQADLAYQIQMLDLLRGILSSYPGGTATSSTTPGNAVGGALGGAALGYQAYDSLSKYLTNQNIANTISNNTSIF